MSLPSMFTCFKTCFYGTEFSVKPVPARETNPITLDNKHMGHDVVLIKDGLRICGTGGALCTAPLVQSKSYFEVKLQQGGIWGIGVATRKTDLNRAPGGWDADSWVYSSDETIRHNGTALHSDVYIPAEGDIIGVTFDHVELNFYVNGKTLDKPILGVKGEIYPVLYVDEGAVLDLIVDHFSYAIPSGFEKIMLEQSLL